MAKIPKLIKAALDFGKMLPEQLLAQGYAILKALTGNVNFTTLPLDLAVLKSALDAYSVSIGDAKDGGKKAITLRNKQATHRHKLVCQLQTMLLTWRTPTPVITHTLSPPVRMARLKPLAIRRRRLI